LLLWCAIIIICDGYDLAVAGIAVPSIMKDMGVTAQNAGFMVSSALFGMMFGAITLGTLADRIGRRWAIAICIALFSVFTAAAGFTHDPYVFSALRFMAGLGIGGVMPNVVAQMTEYSPRKIRATMVTLMFSGYAVGGMLAAILGKGLIEQYGWQSVFLAAGRAGAADSIRAEIDAGIDALPGQAGPLDELKATLLRLDPSYRFQPGDSFELPAVDRASGAPVGKLFHDGRAFSTIMFWVAFFMCLFMVYALSSWLTKLMAGAGYSLGSADLRAGAELRRGDRRRRRRLAGGPLPHQVRAGRDVCAGRGVDHLLGYPVSTPVLFLLVGLAGASTIGTQIVTYAYAGQFYPSAIRSTGIGWASGVGRSGAILAPIVIGTLVGMALPLQQNFIAIAIPAVVATIAVSLIRHGRSATGAIQADPQARPVRRTA
jgi:AAHS family benzoate transporter-like MFS transporter